MQDEVKLCVEILEKAIVFEEFAQPLTIQTVPDPTLPEDGVIVRVAATGICRSDWHGWMGHDPDVTLPHVPGHELAGEIASVGKQVSKWKAGDRVTFDSTIYKLDDWYTLKGLYNLSDDRMVLGVSPGEWKRHGAFAEYVNIPQHILYRIPDGVTFTQASMVEPVAVAERPEADTRHSRRARPPAGRRASERMGSRWVAAWPWPGRKRRF